ncbi:cytochrome c oxidase assembly protein [Castellaniella caeni]|uniref:cytochrome c oxidase assembly protein n=1 Tax=Castellaniella caeni TaxID=266123 RepID=UPI00082EC5BC|nr:cytochrome c oxidase assembly protein [Castellaniella caeni]
MDLLAWLQPWEFSPLLVLAFVASAWLFARGRAVHRVGRIRQILFWVGFALLYLSLHTRIDYYAERMFFIHRLQHLVLHHLGPLLIMGAYPGQVLRAGLPSAWRVRLARARRRPAMRRLETLATHRIFIPFLFVLLVLIWLEPTVQFYSMLDWRIYRFMNWSVVISGLLYWNLILDRRPHPPAALTPGGRILSPVFTMAPQMVAGAVIAFSSTDLYPVFDLCGRALPGIGALDDQVMGGLIMWVPAGLIETFGLLYALGTLMRLSSRGRLPPPRRRVARPTARAV